MFSSDTVTILKSTTNNHVYLWMERFGTLEKVVRQECGKVSFVLVMLDELSPNLREWHLASDVVLHDHCDVVLRDHCDVALRDDSAAIKESAESKPSNMTSMHTPFSPRLLKKASIKLSQNSLKEDIPGGLPKMRTTASVHM